MIGADFLFVVLVDIVRYLSQLQLFAKTNKIGEML